MNAPRRRFLAVLALPAALVIAAACSAGQAAAPAATAAALKGTAAGGLAYGEPATVGAPVPAPDTRGAAPKSGEAQNGVPVPRAFDPDRKLILTASVTLEAKDAWAVSDRIQGIAAGLDGDVLQLAQSGKGEQRSATLTMRVPQDRFNEALRQIRSLDQVEVLSSSVQGQDVTDQFVDLQARLSAKQAEEQRYVALLARASSVDDILKVDAQLNQVRLQIEQLQGQLDSIKSRTTFSTITVQVSPVSPFPTAEPRPVYDPARTAERALAALSQVLRSALDLAIWTLVFGWIPLLVLGLALLVSRTRARSLPTS